jgi:hypothetical protein
MKIARPPGVQMTPHRMMLPVWGHLIFGAIAKKKPGGRALHIKETSTCIPLKSKPKIFNIYLSPFKP